MGKRLTPEEREARIREYNEAKAARQAARLEKRKARAEAYEKAKEARAKKRAWEKRGTAALEINTNDSNKVAQVKKFPTYKGKVEIGDWVGFRWMGMAMEGEVTDYSKERSYRLESDEIAEAYEGTRGSGSGFNEFYTVKDREGTFYPIKKKDILAKKIDNKWIDSCN